MSEHAITEWRDLGYGVEVITYTQGDSDEPAGLLERHPCKTDDRHAGSVPFVPHIDHPEWPTWEVQQWEPLTITPSVLCRTCGCHGWIREGRWVPA